MIDLKHRYDHINEYNRKKYKRIELAFPKEYVEKYLSPAVKASGKSMSSFIREALDEKMGLSEKQEET